MVRKVWEWLTGGGWDSSCAAGAPVPDSDYCAALHCDSVCLTEMRSGETCSVACLQDPASAAACRLAALGVLPGAELEVVQAGAACVFRMGNAEFAVDRQLAQQVRVVRHVTARTAA
ncbi:MAG TPA: FeoA family protein [Longimicrobiales bacterium]|nr:FeoA family protein [Longimicrobiales bacterium]